MITKRYNFLVSGLLFCLLAPPVFAGENPGKTVSKNEICPCDEGREFSKTISREFDQLPNGTTALYNKYGKVDVKTWAENKVKIDVTIIVVANKQSEADDLFSRVNINFSNSTGYVKAETEISDGSNARGGSWWNGIGISTASSCSDFKINYDVFLPIANQLDLKNKYGDSYLAALEGKLSADIKYGDLRSEGLKNDLALTLGYGKANFANAVNVSGSIGYGEFSVGECRNISLETKYSDMKIDRANDLNLTSKYDEFSIGAVHNIALNTSYSDVKTTSAHEMNVTAGYTDLQIGWLGTKGDFDMNYGGLKIDRLDKGFSDLNIDGNYTDFTILVEKGAGFRLDAEGRYAGINYPQPMNITRFDESGSRKSVAGTHGDGKASIKARLNYGGLYLK